MKASEGRLTPFQPLADDDGLDVLFFDNLTVPITVTVTISTGLPYPFTAASIRAISIFPIVIIASNALLATAGSGWAMASVNTRGVICHDSPHLSLHQPHSLSWPPL